MEGELLVEAGGAPGRRPRRRAGRRRRCAAPRPGRSAARPRPGRTARRRTRDAVERPARPGRRTAPTDSSPISPARPRQAGAAAGGDLQGVARRHRRRRRAAACPAASPSRASSHSEAESADAEPSHAEPDRRAGGPQLGDRRQPAAEDHVATTGSAPTPTPRRAQPGRPRRRSGQTQCATHDAVGHPADVLEVARPAGGRTSPGRTRPRPASSARWVCSRTSSRSASSAVARHQRRRDAERRARRQRDPDHRASGDAVVVRAHQPLRVGEDLVVVLDDGVGRQPAVLHRQLHRAAGRVEAHAELAGRRDLGA